MTRHYTGSDLPKFEFDEMALSTGMDGHNCGIGPIEVVKKIIEISRHVDTQHTGKGF